VVQFKAYVVHNYIKTGVFCVITDQSALLEHTGVWLLDQRSLRRISHSNGTSNSVYSHLSRRKM